MKNKIVVIIPARNEEAYIGDLINSLIAQEIKPVEAIFVDDGSTDGTEEIIKTFGKEYSWIKYLKKEDRGIRSVGPGVVETFYCGYNQIETVNYDFVCKLDADLLLPEKYFSTLLGKFDTNQKLGSASGKVFLELGNGSFAKERMADEMVAGQVNFYRRECFDNIGGFVREVMWDGIAYHRARMEGWETRSYEDKELTIIHRRLMGSSHNSVLTGRKRWGKGQYFMGTHPLYIIAIGVYRMLERPFIIGGLMIIWGYVNSFFKKSNRYNYPDFRESLHAWQFERLGLGKRLEKIV